MKIQVVFDFSELERTAINHLIGNHWPADHGRARAWIEANIRADLEVVLLDYLTGRPGVGDAVKSKEATKSARATKWATKSCLTEVNAPRLRRERPRRKRG